MVDVAYMDMDKETFLAHFSELPENGSTRFRFYRMRDGTLKVSPYNVLTNRERASGKILKVIYVLVVTMRGVARVLKADPTLVSCTITYHCGFLEISARPKDYVKRRTLLELGPEYLKTRDLVVEEATGKRVPIV
jgi:hypothetical protein